MRRFTLYRFITVLILLHFCIIRLLSQEFEWILGYDGFLDNREYYNSVQYPQTIFGSRFRFELGGNLDQHHRLRAGLNYLYEFGTDIEDVKTNPVLYYNLDYKPFTFYLGAFPRRDLLDFPLALLTDTLNYYRPNLEGAYLAYKWSWGHQNIFIDWTSRQTDQDFERFMFGFSGKINFSILFVTHHFLMGHFARPRITPPDFHLRDNGGFDLNLGVDLSSMTFLDSLTISVGSLVSLDRIRNVYEGWETPAGILGQAYLSYRGFGLCGTYYRGQGHEFLYGDSFYKAGEYGRMDFFWQPFNRTGIKGKIVFSLHFIERRLDYSQQVLISIDLPGRRSMRIK